MNIFIQARKQTCAVQFIIWNYILGKVNYNIDIKEDLVIALLIYNLLWLYNIITKGFDLQDLNMTEHLPWMLKLMRNEKYILLT